MTYTVVNTADKQLCVIHVVVGSSAGGYGCRASSGGKESFDAAI